MRSNYGMLRNRVYHIWPSLNLTRNALRMQVVNDFLMRHGNEDGGSYFLGATYSAAETLTTPWLARGLVSLPAVRDIDMLAIAEEKGLDRFSRWVKVVAQMPWLICCCC